MSNFIVKLSIAVLVLATFIYYQGLDSQKKKKRQEKNTLSLWPQPEPGSSHSLSGNDTTELHSSMEACCNVFEAIT